MAGPGEARERPAIIHRHQKPGIVDAGFVFIGDHPEYRRPRGGDFAVTDERAEAFALLGQLLEESSVAGVVELLKKALGI